MLKTTLLSAKKLALGYSILILVGPVKCLINDKCSYVEREFVEPQNGHTKH